MKRQSDFSFTAALIIIAVGLTACGSLGSRAVSNIAKNSMNDSNAANVEVRTDLEGLAELINLPVRPSQIKWTKKIFDNSEGAIPGPSDYRLTAVLEYDEKNAAELLQKLEAETTSQSFGRTDVKAWFSEELKAQAKTVDGRAYLEGEKYSSDSFVRSPYRSGNVIRVGKTNYFVLNLASF